MTYAGIVGEGRVGPDRPVMDTRTHARDLQDAHDARDARDAHDAHHARHLTG